MMEGKPSMSVPITGPLGGSHCFPELRLVLILAASGGGCLPRPSVFRVCIDHPLVTAAHTAPLRACMFVLG